MYKHYRLHLIILLQLFCLLSANAQKRNAVWERYIDDHKELAIDQMKRYKIPASITLAQGLFESAAGTSTLARYSNNHFGIKCHNEWTGKRTYRDDDKKNDCFRVYSSAKESYEDHSLFLQRSRYSRLFLLDPLDYKGWAKGLKACGYATLPTYAERLIGVIELYELYKYDTKGSSHGSRLKSDYAVANPHQLYIVNNLDCIVARDGDTWDNISKEMKARGIKISASKLRKYNEAPSKDFFPSSGTNIFLEKKLTHAEKDKYSRDFWHRVKSGESMYSIAQQYGIRLKNLYKLNFRDADYIPEAGDLLRVR